MSIGSLGIVGGVAGSPLTQAKGNVERARESVAAREQRVESDTKAEDAAGIGRTDGENHETTDRDADGRRLYEAPPERPRADDSAATDAATNAAPQACDPTGAAGSQLDLTG